jgi:hypothetical protein
MKANVVHLGKPKKKRSKKPKRRGKKAWRKNTQSQ